MLHRMGMVGTFGAAAAHMGSPSIWAFLIFLVGGLVPAFASATGMLAVLIPLAFLSWLTAGPQAGRSSPS